MPPPDSPRPDQGHARRAHHLDGKRVGPPCRHQPGGARDSPSQSDRVSERHSRSHRAEDRPREIPAVRQFDPRVRQHRGRVDHVAGADGGVPVGGGQDQPAGDGVEHRADVCRVQCSRRRDAELPRRGAAVRHPRRHADRARISCGRRVRVQGRSGLRRQHGPGERPVRPDPGRTAGGDDRRPAGEVVRLGQGDARGAALRRAHSADPREGGPAQGRRHVPREQLRARQQHQQRLSARDDRDRRHSRVSVLSARREGANRRTVERQRRLGHAEPPQDFRLPPGDRREPPSGRGVCADDCVDPRAPGVPPAGDSRRRRHAHGVLHLGPTRRHLR